MPFLKYVVLIETIIAVVLVVYTYIRFMGFIFGGKKYNKEWLLVVGQPLFMLH